MPRDQPEDWILQQVLGKSPVGNNNNNNNNNNNDKLY